jgi:hypothetical protein
MILSRTLFRNGAEFELVNDFHSKLDAQRKLKEIRNGNRCFAKKKSFIFSSQNAKITFSHGVYEQVFRV